MTPQMMRLTLGFLAAFVLVSIAPSLPGLASELGDPLITGQLGDLLMVAGAGLSLAVVAVALHRRWRARPQKPWGAAAGSGLGLRIRQASRQGARVPALARRFGLSQDAIRAAIGREGSSPAAPRGTSFRPRQPALLAKPKVTPVVTKRNPYRALA